MISVGPLTSDDRPAWAELFRGYNEFYGRTLAEDLFARAWREFEKDDQLHALGARLDGRLVGWSARRLYDRAAENRGFIQYVVAL